MNVLIAAYLINRLPLWILTNKSRDIILSQFVYNLTVSIRFTPMSSVVLHLSIFNLVIETNLTQELENVCSLVILPQRKYIYKYYHQVSRKFCTFLDVTFAENQSFFNSSSLQWDTIPNKEEMSEGFLDLSYLSSSPHNHFQNQFLSQMFLVHKSRKRVIIYCHCKFTQVRKTSGYKSKNVNPL